MAFSLMNDGTMERYNINSTIGWFLSAILAIMVAQDLSRKKDTDTNTDPTYKSGNIRVFPIY
jgi:hypothetical protein